MDRRFCLTQTDISKINDITSSHLYTISQRIQSVDIRALKGPRAVDLSMEFWDLLKESKSITKTFKDKVETILACSEEWYSILSIIMNGNKLNEEQIDYISYVLDEYNKYFLPNPSFKHVNNMWTSFMKNYQEYKRREDEYRRMEARQRYEADNKQQSVFSADIVQKLSCALIVIGGFIAYYYHSININDNYRAIGYLLIVLGIAGFFVGRSRHKSEEKNAVNMTRYGSTKSMDEESHGLVSESPAHNVVEIKQLGTVSDQNMRSFFVEFMEELNQANNCNDDVERDNFKEVRVTLGKIMKGFKALQDQCTQMIDRIDNIQNRFNKN